MTLSKAKDSAWRLDASWLAMDRSGELWCGENKPEYHDILPLWIWPFDLKPVKIGWIYPVKDWRSCRWENTQ